MMKFAHGHPCLLVEHSSIPAALKFGNIGRKALNGKDGELSNG